MMSVDMPSTGFYQSISGKANIAINKQFKLDLEAFSHEIELSISTLGRENIESGEVQNAYQQLRSRFKKVSFLLEYLDKEAYDKTLNGAPLPKLEEKVADIFILEPKGLQVIDELMAEPITDETKDALLKQFKALQLNFSNLRKFVDAKFISDRQFFEASRQAIVRMVSLGITGFDTPGTQLGVSDAHEVLESLQQYYSFYAWEFKNIGNTSLFDHTSALFEKGKVQTERISFDDFDRLIFIRDVANPIYEKLLQSHLALSYETIEEVTKYLPALNYNATNIFSKEFFDPFYYVSLKQDSLFDKRKALGRLLFYDPILSGNNKLSCASCHAPEKAFTDGHAKSKSNKGEDLKRNALTLNYSVYATGYFYDLRAKRLEDQFEHVVLSKDEFNTEYQKISEKLSNSAIYLQKFKEAFPELRKGVKTYAIDYALTAYVMSLSTFDNPVDTYFSNKNTKLSEDVKKGFNLFTGKANCATCHFLPLYAGTVPPLYDESEAEVLGVPVSVTDSLTIDTDLGRSGNGMTQEIAYFYKHSFKTPTLRNIDLTAPYMHNGAFRTLEEVMDFYNQGGGMGRGMPITYQTLAPDPLNLSKEEIHQIIAFMKALTDVKQHEKPRLDEFPTDFQNKEWNSRSIN